MAAGRTPGRYITDLYFLPAGFSVDVPNNLFAQANLGWGAASPTEAKTAGKVTHRHAVGLDPVTGRRFRATIPDLAAPIWTGAATTWDVIQNDGTTLTVTVTGLVGEKASK